MKKGQIISSMVLFTVILLVIARLETGSLNPVEIFRGDSLFLKIVAGFLILGLLQGVIQLRRLQGPLANLRCPSKHCDGKPLLEFAPVFGQPVRCVHCRRWFHHQCLKSNGGGLMEGCKQPGCSSYQGGFDMPGLGG